MTDRRAASSVGGRRTRPRSIALILVPLLLSGVVPRDEGDPITTGPAVATSRSEVTPGDSIGLTIDGFTSPYVTISICGNESRRGSADCDMAASEGVEFPVSGAPLVLQMPVGEPPADCPCVVRVVGPDSTEIAVAPLVITGHPVGPVIDPPVVGDLLSVSISARQASAGTLETLRSALGGPTVYEVTVTVKNRSAQPLKQVRVSGSASRSTASNLATLDLTDPGLIGVGQTWQQTVIAKVPAPSFGSVEWRVAASGAGPTVVTTKSTQHRPILLSALALLVVVNVSLLAIRWRIRRRAVRRAGRLEVPSEGDVVIEATSSEDPTIPVDAVASAVAEQLAELLGSARR